MPKKVTIILWSLIWAGLYTGSYRIFARDLPASLLESFNWFRAFLPLIAAVLALLFVVRGVNIDFLSALGSPVGLLILYGFSGLISFVFSPDPPTAFYWAAVFVAVPLVIWACLRDLRLLITMNRAVAIFMTFFFSLGPLRPQWSAIIESGRPAMFSFAANVGMLGLGPVTANGMGRFAAVAGIAALVRIASNELRWRVGWMFVFVVSVVTLALTISRTSMIGFGLALIVVLWVSRMGWKSIPIASGYAFLIWISLFHWTPIGDSALLSQPTSPASQPTSPTFISQESRGSAERVSKDITGRIATWSEGLEVTSRSPLFGFGFQADRFLVTPPVGIYVGAHMSNSYFQALIQTGIIGTIFFLGAFIVAWKHAFRFLANRSVAINGTDRLFLTEALALLVFFTFRSLFESTAAFYGVDLIFLVPALLLIQSVSQQTLKRRVTMTRLRLLTYSKPVVFLARRLGIHRLLRKLYFWVARPPNGVIEQTVGGFPAKFYVHTPEELRMLEVMYGEGHILEHLLATLLPNDVLYDVGANLGLYAIFFARAVGNGGQIIAFEPERDSYSRLMRNLELNGLSNVRPYCKAIGEIDGTARLAIGGTTGNYSLVRTYTNEIDSQTIQVVAGDDFIEKESLPLPNVLKIDVEGFELSVLRGLQRTLSKPQCRLVYCELHPPLWPPETKPNAVFDLMSELGFQRFEKFPRRGNYDAFFYK